MKINTPNKLTLVRILLVPAFMLFIMYPIPDDHVSRFIAAFIFFATALTDFFDGYIARHTGAVTNFGKFLDTLADKFMILGALIAFCASPEYNFLSHYLVWVTLIVFLRELSVTSLRLLVKTGEGKVVGANIAGKLKTVSQCVCVMTLILEPVVVTERYDWYPGVLSLFTMGVMVSLTLLSGYLYFRTYWKDLDPQA